MKRRISALVALMLVIGCSSSENNNAAAGGSGGGSGLPSGGTGGAVATGGAGGSGGMTSATYQTCMDILSCIADCPDADANCPDLCYAAGSNTGQSQLVALLTCMDQKQCTEVACIETQCSAELTTCLDSSTTGGGTPNPGGTVPTGAIPSELVGHWVRPGSSDVADFSFLADGSAAHSKYKESSVGSCSMSVHSEWKTGAAVASGDQLTVTLSDGATAVAWVGGCGSSYTNTAPGKVLQYKYALDLSGASPGVWLTDLSCTGQNCEEYYQKQ